jgi:hypothetical protein
MKKIMVPLLCLLGSGLLAGCAFTGKMVELPYAPVVNAVGGGGELYLARSAEPASSEGKGRASWIVGVMKNNEGERIGDVVTGVPPGELLLHAFAEEFRAAGYAVKTVGAIPSGAAGINFSRLTIAMEQATSLMKVDARSRVTVVAELWQNGKPVATLDYEAAYADSAVTHRDQLLQFTLEKAVQALMKKAVPEIIGKVGVAGKLPEEPRPAPVVAPAASEPSVIVLPPRALTVMPAPAGFYLVWQEAPQVQTSVTGYEIARATATGGPYTAVATVGKGVFLYHDSAAGGVTTYFYKVRAMAGKAYSPYTEVVATGK